MIDVSTFYLTIRYYLIYKRKGKIMNDNAVKKKHVVPHVYVILLVIVAICAILTYMIPAGAYDRIEGPEGRMIVDSTSYHAVDQNPAGIFDVLMSIPKGMVETAQIIFFIFILGGSFQVMNATGAVEAAIGKLTISMGNRGKMLLPIIMIIFSLCGAVFGMAEETLPFIPIMVTLCIAMGYDSLTGAGIVLVGAGAGFAGAFMNPFTVGVAQGIAELPLFSGIQFRLVAYALMVLLSIGFMMWYSAKIKVDPTKSLMHSIDMQRTDKLDLATIPKFDNTHTAVLVIFVATMALLIFGVLKYEWYIQEISALFLGMSILIGIVARLGLYGYGEEFVVGLSGIAGGALVVGFARAILVVLNEGNIMDTILYTIASGLSTLPAFMSAIGMYLFQCFLNFIVPSGSGQAAVSMPIMAPLADIVGVTRQTAVLAYQFGDGISNIFTPTSGYFMAGLALAKIPWDKWAKWILPLILLQYLLGAIVVIVAQMIQLGPF